MKKMKPPAPLDQDERAALARSAVKHGLPQVRRHILICADPAKPKCCTAEEGEAAWEYMKARLQEQNLSEYVGIYLTKAH